MEPKDIYCIIEGMKRLKEKGVAPSKAHKIAKKVYQIVKQSCQTIPKK